MVSQLSRGGRNEVWDFGSKLFILSIEVSLTVVARVGGERRPEIILLISIGSVVFSASVNVTLLSDVLS